MNFVNNYTFIMKIFFFKSKATRFDRLLSVYLNFVRSNLPRFITFIPVLRA